MSPIEERLAPYAVPIVSIYSTLFIAGCFTIHSFIRPKWRKVAADWYSIVLRISCRPWSVTDAVAIVSAIIAINFLLAPLLRHQLSSGSFSALVAGLTMMHGVMLTAMFAILWKKRVGLRSAFGGGSHRFMDDVRTGGAGFLSMVVAVVPAMILTGLILKAMNRDGEPQEIISLFAMQDGVFKRVFIAGWAVLIAPIAEEMLFRGILLPLALRRFTPVPAVLLVSVFFAFIHQSETAFLPLIAVSASLCLAFMATESIVVSITMHALFNALTTSFVLMSG